MQEYAARLSRPLVDGEAAWDLAQEFEIRLAEGRTLAFRVAFAVLRHQQDAEDAVQEACSRAYRRFGQLRDRDRFRAWLVRMTWRISIDARRGERRRALRETASVVDATTGAETSSQEDALLSRERRERLWTAIDRLPEKLRLAVILNAIDGHAIRDVARLLGVPEGTVKSRLFDARKKLQEWVR